MAQAFSHLWLTISRFDLETERLQCEQEGKDTAGLADEFARLEALDLPDPRHQADAQALLDKTIALPTRAGYAFVEPSDLEGIRAQRGPGPALPRLALSDAQLRDKVHGAWLGRVCGCLLGKPVEGWRREKMWGYLRESERWPLAGYFTRNVPQAVLDKHDLKPGRNYIEEVSYFPEDDDINYTTTGLAIMQKHGPGFTPIDVANFWLTDIPILHTCTAERVAYRNLAMLIPPPRSATYRNVYREWIGAQIRADFFGYAAAGNPELAAEYAWRDASISHVKNGIYGEMWAAAMVAVAFVSDEPGTIIEAGLAQVPRRSRLHDAVTRVIKWRGEGVKYDQAVDRIHQEWDETRSHDWCHTISNAMVVAVGLLWGEMDYSNSICRAVQPCLDTDCNGATVGSVVGAVLGVRGVPTKWSSPINNTIATGVAGFHRAKIDEMADHTMKVISAVRG